MRDILEKEVLLSVVRSATIALLRGGHFADVRDLILEKYGVLAQGWYKVNEHSIVSFVEGYVSIPLTSRYEARQEFYEGVVQ